MANIIWSTSCALLLLILWTTSALLTTSAVNGSAELTMKPLGDRFYKPVGGSMVFTCELTLHKRVIGHSSVDDGYIDDEEEASEDSGYKLRWFDKDQNEIVDKTGRRYVEEEDFTKKLYITNIEQTDEGEYRCSVDVDGVMLDKKVTLGLFKQIGFESAETPQYLRIYSDAVVRCIVVGQPLPEVSWRYKGSRVVLDSNRYSKVDEGLLIRNVTLKDNGDYTCRAEVESDGRYDERKLKVEVHIPPQITEPPSNVEAIDGEDVTMSCSASGLPQPTYTFYKDNIAVTNTSTGNRITVDPLAGTINFKPVLKSDEDIRYNCSASNDVGVDSAVGELRVLVRPTIHELKDVKAAEFHMAKLICIAHGDPTPSITFQRVGQPSAYQLGENDDDRIRTSALGDGRLELTIDMLKPEDAGDYQCNAVSKIGRHNDTAKLTVEYKPRFASTHNTVEYIWAGKTRNMSCTAEAVPEATFQWMRRNQPLTNNGSYHMHDSGNGTSQLEVTVRESDQLWIYGNYTCAAQNAHGRVKVDIELKRATVPNEPRSVNVTSRTPNVVTIKIEAPEEDGGMPILGYRIEYNDVVYDASTVTTEGTGPPFATSASTAAYAEGNIISLDNLKPSTMYLLTVRARNEVGVGSPTQIEVMTEDIRKPYPLELTSPKEGEHSMTYRITWNKPNTGGRKITLYEFRYKRVTHDTNGKMKHVDKAWKSVQREDNTLHPMRDFELTGLQPNAHYILQVRARNDMGVSDYTEEFMFRTAPASHPVSVASRNSFNGIFWPLLISAAFIHVASDRSRL